MLGQGRHLGVIPLAIKDVYTLVAQHPDREFTIKVSYLEIYNEIIRDLLSEAPLSTRPNDKDPVGLKLRQGKVGGAFVEGLNEITINNVRDGLGLIVAGEERRKVAATNWNEHSSRSHTIFRLRIESRSVDDGSVVRVSNLNLVDLAGSECIAHLGKDEARRSECRQINSSLHALGRVILKLSQGELKKGHVPFRDSKLTRLLQPSLGGNCRTAVVCTITPAYVHAEETLNTIRFALRAQHVRQHAKVNEVTHDGQILRRYESEILTLKQQLEEAKASSARGMKDHGMHVREMQRLLEELDEAKEEVHDLEKAVGELQDDLDIKSRQVSKQTAEIQRQHKTQRALEKEVQHLKKNSFRGEARGINSSEEDEKEETYKLKKRLQREKARAGELEAELEAQTRRTDALEMTLAHMKPEAVQTVEGKRSMTGCVSTVTKAVEEGDQSQITNSILWLVLTAGVKMQLMRKGTETVMVRLNESHDALMWCKASGIMSQAEWNEIPLSQVLSVTPGHSKGHFRGHTTHASLRGTQTRSFSIEFKGHRGHRDETLDLVAPSNVAFDLWQEGLERLM